jgi:SAM-dependent methyltransferase
MAARLVGESGRVIVTDFTPEMVAAARRRAEELGVQNAEFRVLDAELMDLKTDCVDGVLCRWAYMLMIDPLRLSRTARSEGRIGWAATCTGSTFPGRSCVRASNRDESNRPVLRPHHENEVLTCWR